MDKQYKLVPVEPTEEMLKAAMDASVLHYGAFISEEEYSGCYKSMISAAPTQPSPAESDPVAWMACSENRAPIFFPDEKEAFLLCGTSEWTITPVYSHTDESNKEAVRNAALDDAIQACREWGEGSAGLVMSILINRFESLKSQPAQPSDTEMLDWMINHEAALDDHTVRFRVIHQCKFKGQVIGQFMDTPREAIKAAMQADREGS